MFTTLDSIEDILARPGMRDWLRYLYSDHSLELFPSCLASEPLRLSRHRARTPWGDDLCDLADQLVDAANLVLELQSGKRRCLSLRTWDDWHPREGSSSVDPSATFLITPRSEAEKSARRPAVIICPGGGYEMVSFQNEGTPVQRYFEDRGFAAFTLRYRVAPSRWPEPQRDLLDAFAWVREHADDYGIDQWRISLFGFSAAGHLCASATALAMEERPDVLPNALVLGYPVISFSRDVTHEGSFRALTGGDESLRERLSVEHLVRDGFPPTFAWACEDDDTVPCENVELLASALEAQGSSHDCRVYPTGGHGCGLAFHASAWDWAPRALEFLRSR